MPNVPHVCHTVPNLYMILSRAWHAPGTECLPSTNLVPNVCFGGAAWVAFCAPIARCPAFMRSYLEQAQDTMTTLRSWALPASPAVQAWVHRSSHGHKHCAAGIPHSGRANASSKLDQVVSTLVWRCTRLTQRTPGTTRRCLQISSSSDAPNHAGSPCTALSLY